MEFFEEIEWSPWRLLHVIQSYQERQWNIAMLAGLLSFRSYSMSKWWTLLNQNKRSRGKRKLSNLSNCFVMIHWGCENKQLDVHLDGFMYNGVHPSGSFGCDQGVIFQATLIWVQVMPWCLGVDTTGNRLLITYFRRRSPDHMTLNGVSAFIQIILLKMMHMFSSASFMQMFMCVCCPRKWLRRK